MPLSQSAEPVIDIVGLACQESKLYLRHQDRPRLVTGRILRGKLPKLRAFRLFASLFQLGGEL